MQKMFDAKAYAKKWASENRDKTREYCRRYAERNREKLNQRAKERRLRSPHKIYAARNYPEATRPCPDVCECCGSPPGKKALHLDHDHVTNEFRGWLCSKCNSGIGMLGDSIAGVEKAMKYLARLNNLDDVSH